MVVGLLAFAACVTADPKLVISSASVDFDSVPPQLTLTGEFGRKAVEVLLDGQILEQSDKTPTVIVAKLPPEGLEPGTDRLRVRKVHGNDNTVQYSSYERWSVATLS